MHKSQFVEACFVTAKEIQVKNAVFTAVKKGIGTSISYEKDGKKADDFSTADSENIIELNGMKSELVICMNDLKELV